MLHRGPGYCPSCGERVTPFAAGCAICGAELDPARWDNPPATRLGRLRAWVLPRPRRTAETRRRS
jgi:predicted amidophosphoribosyltransferase